MPNGLDLGLTVFAQWRTQQVGGSTASGHTPNSHFVGDMINAF